METHINFGPDNALESELSKGIPIKGDRTFEDDETQGCSLISPTDSALDSVILAASFLPVPALAVWFTKLLINKHHYENCQTYRPRCCRFLPCRFLLPKRTDAEVRTDDFLEVKLTFHIPACLTASRDFFAQSPRSNGSNALWRGTPFSARSSPNRCHMPATASPRISTSPRAS
jgi:hypothetical protein